MSETTHHHNDVEEQIEKPELISAAPPLATWKWVLTLSGLYLGALLYGML